MNITKLFFVIRYGHRWWENHERQRYYESTRTKVVVPDNSIPRGTYTSDITRTIVYVNPKDIEEYDGHN